MFPELVNNIYIPIVNCVGTNFVHQFCDNSTVSSQYGVYY